MLPALLHFFFFNDTATTEIYTLSLHDALPILRSGGSLAPMQPSPSSEASWVPRSCSARSEEHTSELQSRQYLVCRLLLEKKIYRPTLQASLVIECPAEHGSILPSGDGV